MQNPRRLTAALAAAALAWTGLALGVAAPAAQADTGNRDAPHDPATYYAGTEGLSGTALATALNAIIDGNTFLPYTSGATDVWDALDTLDQDPNDPTKIIDVYSGDSLVLTNKCGSSCALDGWNREHTWSQSRGSFDTDPGPGTDLFHMRPSRGNTNSSRGNLDFDETVNSGGPVPGCPVVCQRDGDSFEPREAIKGDIARGLFYMDVRYNGDADDQFAVDLQMWDTTGDSGSQIGKLSTLVAWSVADPPDNAERTRNDLIDGNYQHNRNPFIDHPEWVCSIWGSANPTACAAPPNVAPTTSPMTKTTPEDTPTTVALAATDADGDTLTWSLDAADPAEHGTAGVTGSTLSYTPAANFNSTVGGTDVVGVKVDDGHGHVVATTVTITVTAVNDAPVATAQLVTASENAAKVVTLAGTDVDGNPLTYAIATTPAHGTVDLTGNQATYTPATDYSGPDAFTFTVNDGTVSSAAATISITVTAINDAPVATPASVTTAEDTAKVITLAGTDADGNTLTYAIATTPSHGTVDLSGDQATYTPATDYSGPDTFTFTVNDGTVSSAPATVSITVTAVNDAPVASAGTKTTPEDAAATVALVASDVDGTVQGYAIATQPGHGTVSVSGSTATYTPAANYNGPDSFTFTASDGSATSAPATVSVNVTPVNDAPTVNAAALATTFGSPVTAMLAAFDVDGDAVTIIAATSPTHGSVAYAGKSVTYSPTGAGTDAFVVTVTDGHGAIATAQVGVEVAKAAPTLKISGGSLKAGKPGTIKVKLTGVAGVAPSGKVKLKVGGQTLTVTLKKGVATFKIAKLPNAAQLKVKAKYLGDGQYAAGSAKKTFTLK